MSETDKNKISDERRAINMRSKVNRLREISERKAGEILHVNV